MVGVEYILCEDHRVASWVLILWRLPCPQLLWKKNIRNLKCSKFNLFFKKTTNAKKQYLNYCTYNLLPLAIQRMKCYVFNVSFEPHLFCIMLRPFSIHLCTFRWPDDAVAYFQVLGGAFVCFCFVLFFIKNMFLHSTSTIFFLFFYDVTCTSEKAESFNTGTPHWVYCIGSVRKHLWTRAYDDLKYIKLVFQTANICEGM